MPLKWKIYRACTMYLIAWSSLLLVAAFYSLTGAPISIANMRNFAIGATFIFMFFLKALSSLKAIRLLKHGEMHSKAGKIIFIGGFVLNALFFLLGLWLCISEIIPKYFSAHQNPLTAPRITNYILDWSLFAALLCSAFLAVFDFQLLNAIRVKHFGFIDTIGQHIHS